MFVCFSQTIQQIRLSLVDTQNSTVLDIDRVQNNSCHAKLHRQRLKAITFNFQQLPTHQR